MLLARLVIVSDRNYLDRGEPEAAIEELEL